ncbi:Glycosyl hydrolases family 43 [Aspergillus sclerotialis]|uniref:Glycosyl hydrolases family 43 n=1 Tax=Aspergillus sclerotialis TaxID=2070753 RepID=A0A3A2ZPA4_9EURO|nr:Glycosyl hydrolases family 43 [Aspergillus sclerotialis]
MSPVSEKKDGVALQIDSCSDSLQLKLSTESNCSLEKPSPSPWSRKRIALAAAASLLGLISIVLVIALPIVIRHRSNHQEIPDDDTTSDDDYSNYSNKENSPILALDNFPDPGLLHFNGTWLAYGTNTKRNDPNTTHVQVATSQDFKNWTKLDGYDAMPTLGGWESGVNHWAPDVFQRGDGKFVLYYSGQSKDWERHHCVGMAVSDGTDPIGPYIPEQNPLACPRNHGGAIDPSPFKDVDGKLYVTYKADGDSVGLGGDCNNGIEPLARVPIMLQEVKSDGVTRVGDPVQILDINKSDGPLVEAPNIIRTENGMYYLFFSSHCFTSPKYNVKYAYSKSLKGPYKRAHRALLKTGDFGLTSPGGATVSHDGTKMVFHANCGEKRCMYATDINIEPDSTITIAGL